MKLTNKEYAKVAQRELKETYGFAPPLKDIIILEGGDDGMIVTCVGFAVNKKGYCWRLGDNVIGCEAYDLK